MAVHAAVIMEMVVMRSMNQQQRPLKPQQQLHHVTEAAAQAAHAIDAQSGGPVHDHAIQVAVIMDAAIHHHHHHLLHHAVNAQNVSLGFHVSHACAFQTAVQDQAVAAAQAVQHKHQRQLLRNLRNFLAQISGLIDGTEFKIVGKMTDGTIDAMIAGMTTDGMTFQEEIHAIQSCHPIEICVSQFMYHHNDAIHAMIGI